MPSFVRSVTAVVAGCFAAFFHIAAIERLGHILYPPPEGIETAGPEAISAYLKAIPLGAILMVLLAYVAGTFAGSWLAARLAPRPKLNHGLVIGALFLILTLANLALIPHPAWFWAAGLVLIPLMSYLGAALALRGATPALDEARPGGLES